jgi:hypothetical protein
VSGPLILQRPMRRRHWGWSWRLGCVSAEIHEPVAQANAPHLEAYLVKVFVYGEDIILAYETTPARAGALATRKLRQIHLCLAKVIDS